MSKGDERSGPGDEVSWQTHGTTTLRIAGHS